MGVIVADRNLSKCQAVMSAVKLKAKIHVYRKEPYENTPKYVLELHQAKQQLHSI